MPPTDPESTNFEYSIDEIEEQLKALGITDISATGLANFQQDLQKLVNEDSQLNENQNDSELTLSQNYNFDEVSETISLSEDDNDDAVSIMSTTNMSVTSSAAARKRKTLRNGVTHTTTNHVTQAEQDLENLMNSSLNTTLTDYLEPEIIPGATNTGRYRSFSDQQTTSNSKSKSTSSKSKKSNKSTNKSNSNSKSTGNRVNFQSYDDSYTYTESKSNDRNRQSLYDEKIDDFVKALLEGDETVLDNESISDISRANDELNIAAGLNKQRNRNNSNSKRSASKTSNVYSNAYSNNQDIDVEQLPPPPSFMRPSTAPPAGKRVNFHDPVKRFAEYNKYWNSQPRCNPKRDHKRTTQIKWQVRNELADLVRENDRRLLRVKEEMGDYGGHWSFLWVIYGIHFS